jgi:hypothetical protein
MDRTLVVGAVGIGVYQMFDSLRKEHTPADLPDLYLGVLASLMWLVYQARKGANASALYSGAALVLQLYLITAVYHRDRERRQYEDSWLDGR